MTTIIWKTSLFSFSVSVIATGNRKGKQFYTSSACFIVFRCHTATSKRRYCCEFWKFWIQFQAKFTACLDLLTCAMSSVSTSRNIAPFRSLRDGQRRSESNQRPIRALEHLRSDKKDSEYAKSAFRSPECNFGTLASNAMFNWEQGTGNRKSKTGNSDPGTGKPPSTGNPSNGDWGECLRYTRMPWHEKCINCQNKR